MLLWTFHLLLPLCHLRATLWCLLSSFCISQQKFTDHFSLWLHYQRKRSQRGLRYNCHSEGGHRLTEGLILEISKVYLKGENTNCLQFTVLKIFRIWLQWKSLFVLVFWGCYNKLLPIWWLRTAIFSSPSFRGWKSEIGIPGQNSQGANGPHSLQGPQGRILSLPAGMPGLMTTWPRSLPPLLSVSSRDTCHWT